MLIEESAIKKSNKNYKKSSSQISNSSNRKLKNYHSSSSGPISSAAAAADFLNNTNLNNLPNSKIKKLMIISTLFNFLVLLSVIIYSFYNENYLLNISYIEKNNNKNNNNNFISIFNINKYMFYIIIFGLIFFEFAKLIFLLIRKNCKKLSKFVYMEMSYWFIVLKFFYGLNILLMNFLFFNFYLNFLISIILSVFEIGKKKFCGNFYIFIYLLII